MLKIIHEDNHLLAVSKPAGVLVQGDNTGDASLLEMAKEYIRVKYGKKGNVFLGLVHRIDRPVSGTIVFARTSKAASRLVRMFREREVNKIYIAVVKGALDPSGGEIKSFLVRRGKRSRTAGPASSRTSGKEAIVKYRTIGYINKMSLLELKPETGRHHQLRVQLAYLGYPILGDMKYGAKTALPDRSIALHAWKLSFVHPVGGGVVDLETPPPGGGPWMPFRHFY